MNGIEVATIIIAVIVAVFSIIVIKTMPIMGARPVNTDCLGTAIRTAADDAAIPLDVFTRLLESESGLDPLAKGTNPNGSTDHGIAQLNSYYLTWFGDKYLGGGALDPYDVPRALRVSSLYLRDLADLFEGCWACAVGAYKLGPSGWAVARKHAVLKHEYESIGGAHTCTQREGK